MVSMARSDRSSVWAWVALALSLLAVASLGFLFFPGGAATTVYYNNLDNDLEEPPSSPNNTTGNTGGDTSNTAGESNNDVFVPPGEGESAVPFEDPDQTDSETSEQDSEFALPYEYLAYLGSVSGTCYSDPADIAAAGLDYSPEFETRLDQCSRAAAWNEFCPVGAGRGSSECVTPDKLQSAGYYAYQGDFDRESGRDEGPSGSKLVGGEFNKIDPEADSNRGAGYSGALCVGESGANTFDVKECIQQGGTWCSTWPSCGECIGPQCAERKEALFQGRRYVGDDEEGNPVYETVTYKLNGKDVTVNDVIDFINGPGDNDGKLQTLAGVLQMDSSQLDGLSGLALSQAFANELAKIQQQIAGLGLNTALFGELGDFIRDLQKEYSSQIDLQKYCIENPDALGCQGLENPAEGEFVGPLPEGSDPVAQVDTSGLSIDQKAQFILCITLNPLNAAVCFAEAAAVSNGAPPDESSQPLTPPERDESKLKILDKIKEWRTCIKGQHAKGLSYFSSALYTGCADIFGPDYSDGASRDQLIGILSGYFGGLPPDTPTTCDGEQVTDQIGGIVDCFKENETVCMTLGTEEYCAENLQELYFKTRAYQGDPNRLLGPYSLAQINAIQNCALESPAFVGLCVAESGVFDPNTPLDSLLRFLTPEQAEQFITKGAGAVDSWHTCIRAGLSAGEKLTSGLWARCGDQNFGPNYKDVDPDLLLGLLLPIADLIPAGVPATCDQEPISSARGIADCFQQKEKVCLVIDGKTRCADGPVELADLAIGSFGTVLPEQDLDGTLTPEGWEIFMANIRCLAGDPIFAQLCAVADEVGAGADVGTGEETPPELLPLARCMIENSFNLVLCMAQSGLYTTPGQPDKTDEAELPAEPAVNEFAGAYIPPEKLGKIGCVGGGHAGESVGVTVSAGACIAEGGIVVDTETGDQFATTEDLCIGMTPKDGCIEIEEPIEPTETELDRAASIANDINDIKKLQTGNQTFLGTCKQNLDFGTCSQLCFDGFVYQFLSAAECVYDTVGEQAPERDWAIRTEIYRKGFFSDSLETTLDASNLDEFNRQFYGFDSVNYRQNSCVYDRISGDVAYCTSDPNFIRAQRYFNRPQ